MAPILPENEEKGKWGLPKKLKLGYLLTAWVKVLSLPRYNAEGKQLRCNSTRAGKGAIFTLSVLTQQKSALSPPNHEALQAVRIQDFNPTLQGCKTE